MGPRPSGIFGPPRPRRILCASCHRLFDAARPVPGERVRCEHCNETVEVGQPVVRRSRHHSSRTSITSWADAPRSAASESLIRAAMVAALAWGVVLVLGSLGAPDTASERATGSRTDEDLRLEDAVFNDTNGW